LRHDALRAAAGRQRFSQPGRQIDSVQHFRDRFLSPARQDLLCDVQGRDDPVSGSLVGMRDGPNPEGDRSVPNALLTAGGGVT